MIEDHADIFKAESLELFTLEQDAVELIVGAKLKVDLPAFLLNSV